MVIANKNIKCIKKSDLNGHDTIQLVNCIIEAIDLIGAFELKVHLVIESCIINDLQIHSCWFEDGLLLKGSVVKNYVDYQMGGHNSEPIVIDGNVFVGFFNFFDCQFKNVIELKNNVFKKGTNLLGNKGEGFENSFANGWVVEDNVGHIDLDEIGTY
jgi:hypothetical protein